MFFFLSILKGEFIKLFSEDIFTSGCMPQPQNYNPATGETPTYTKNRSRQSTHENNKNSAYRYLNTRTGGVGSNLANTYDSNSNKFSDFSAISGAANSLGEHSGSIQDIKSVLTDGPRSEGGGAKPASHTYNNGYSGAGNDQATVNRAFDNVSGKASYISRMRNNSGFNSGYGNNFYNAAEQYAMGNLIGNRLSHNTGVDTDTSVFSSMRNLAPDNNMGASAYARASDALARNTAYYSRIPALQKNIGNGFDGSKNAVGIASDGEAVGSGDLPGAEYGGGYDSRGVGIPINGAGVCSISGTSAANAINWNLEFKTDGEIIIHYPTDDNNNVWSVGGNGILYMASNHGGIDQGMMFRRLSPGKYQIVSNSQMCVTYIPARERFEMQRCHDTQFQEFAFTYDLNGGNCCSYEIYQWIVTPFGRYKKEYDSKRHHRVGDKEHPLNGYYFNYSNAGLNELNRQINMAASIANAQNDLAQW